MDGMLGSGRWRTVRTDENVECVEDLVQWQEDQSQTHKCQWQTARQLNILQRTVDRIIRDDLHLKCFKCSQVTELTKNNNRDRYERAKKLLQKYPASLASFMVFTDKKSQLRVRRISQNDRVYAMAGTVKKTCQLVDCHVHVLPSLRRWWYLLGSPLWAEP